MRQQWIKTAGRVEKEEKNKCQNNSETQHVFLCSSKYFVADKSNMQMSVLGYYVVFFFLEVKWNHFESMKLVPKLNTDY